MRFPNTNCRRLDLFETASRSGSFTAIAKPGVMLLAALIGCSLNATGPAEKAAARDYAMASIALRNLSTTMRHRLLGFSDLQVSRSHLL
jgi:hypothetical protein